ncbi:MAG: hypothetical protein VKI83_02140 [Synechococcaceae cyanobacterium]|nr:hypothetical protein [Synechococcaceae cyanobacterium]
MLGLGLSLLVQGCEPAHRRPTWHLFPLARQQPHDGLAVVSQPDGYGLHIWIETDTSQEGVCRPRWIPDPARLFNGNGSAPFSSGLASRAEFFEAMRRPAVRSAFRREFTALCRRRAPRSSVQWLEPPQRPEQLRSDVFPMHEERHLLSDPEAIRRAEEQFLGKPLQPLQPQDSKARPSQEPR